MKARYLVVITFLVFSPSCYQYTNSEELTEINNDKKVSSTNLNYNTIKTSVFKTEIGWGYNIIVDEKIYIRQAYIPAINGLKSFATPENAEKVATYAAEKLKRTHKLPSISYKELDSLNAL